MKRAIVVGLGLLGWTMTVAAAETPTTGPTLRVKETLVGHLGQVTERRAYAISPDNRHVAVLKTTPGGKQMVTLDNVPGKEYEWIVPQSITFTGDSNHLAYVVQKKDGMCVVQDGAEGKTYHEVVGSTLVAPREGARLAYGAIAKPGGKRMVVLDGQESPEYDQIGHFSFSPDGKRFVHACENGGKHRFVIDGAPDPEQEKVILASLTWSPDSKRLAYIVARGEKVAVVLDGQEQPAYEAGSRLVFSPDSKHAAYVATRNGKMAVVLDGKEQPEQDRIASHTLHFSPDSRRMSYLASRVVKEQVDGRELTKEKLYWVIDGKPTPEYERVMAESLVFSPDSKRVAYIIVRDKHFVAVVDGAENKPAEDIRLMQFTGDSEKLVYLALWKNRIHTVVNNFEGPGYENVSNLLQSPDGKRIACAAGREGTTFVVIDGVEGPKFAEMVPGTIAFSPDGKHVAYEVKAKRGERPMIAVDGATTPEHDGTLRQSRMVWDSPTTLRALVLRQGEIHRMEIEVGP